MRPPVLQPALDHAELDAAVPPLLDEHASQAGDIHTRPFAPPPQLHERSPTPAEVRFRKS